MGDPGSGSREQVDLLPVQLYAMGMPDVIACPTGGPETAHQIINGMWGSLTSWSWRNKFLMIAMA